MKEYTQLTPGFNPGLMHKPHIRLGGVFAAAGKNIHDKTHNLQVTIKKTPPSEDGGVFINGR